MGYETEYLEKVRNYNLEQNMADATSLAQLLFCLSTAQLKVVIARFRERRLLKGRINDSV
ncbi:MAG: hypothetical protein R3B93_27645 [Bacteroidia bacterium]